MGNSLSRKLFSGDTPSDHNTDDFADTQLVLPVDAVFILTSYPTLCLFVLSTRSRLTSTPTSTPPSSAVPRTIHRCAWSSLRARVSCHALTHSAHTHHTITQRYGVGW